MSRAKRPRLSTEPDRISTAAYAASQPLFSTLRNATDAIDTQKASLTTARDVVQQLHVKIDTEDAQRHESYMQNVVSAWEAATEAYCKVFEELCNVTRANDSEGRPQGKRHEEFARILETARQARDAVTEYAPAKGEEEEAVLAADEDDFEKSVHVETTTQTESAVSSNGKKRKLADADPLPDINPHQRPDDSDEDEIVVRHNPASKKSNVVPTLVEKPSKDTKTPPPKSMLDDTIRYSRLDPRKIIWKNGELKVPFERLSPDERKAWGAIKKRQKRQTQRTKAKTTRAKGSAAAKSGAEKKLGNEAEDDAIFVQYAKPESSAPTPTPANGQGNTIPAVEYEDVSAEVEARLKAKADKKAHDKAKRAEKKRKRETGDSFVNPCAEQQDPEPVEGVVEDGPKDKPVKPAKKKSKKSADSGVSLNGITVDAKEELKTKKKAPRKIEKRKNAANEDDGDEIKVAEAPSKQATTKKMRHT